MISVVSYPDRGEGGSGKYRGNFSPHLVEDLVDHFRPRKVVDPMAGSYTTRDVCQRMGIPVWSSDLKDGFDILASEIPEGGDLGILHPPYYDMIIYSGQVWGEADPRDLSRAGNYEEFLRRLDEAQYRLYESLRLGGHLAVLIGDVKRRGMLYPIQRDMRWYGQPVNLVIKMQHNCWSDRLSYKGSFIRIVHEYLVITKKPEAWLVAIRDASRQECDARKYEGITWRALVQSCLEENGGDAFLHELYSSAKVTIKVRRAEENGHDWKAQIRRALQVYPDFENVEYGRWRLT